MRDFQNNIYFCFIDYAKAFESVDHNKVWKILKKMEIPDHLTCLLRNLYAGQEARVRTGHGTAKWFQKEKEYVKAVYCHPAGDQPRLIQGIRSGDGVGEDQETIA